MSRKTAVKTKKELVNKIVALEKKTEEFNEDYQTDIVVLHRKLNGIDITLKSILAVQEGMLTAQNGNARILSAIEDNRLCNQKSVSRIMNQIGVMEEYQSARMGRVKELFERTEMDIIVAVSIGVLLLAALIAIL